MADLAHYYRESRPFRAQADFSSERYSQGPPSRKGSPGVPNGGLRSRKLCHSEPWHRLFHLDITLVGSEGVLFSSWLAHSASDEGSAPNRALWCWRMKWPNDNSGSVNIEYTVLAALTLVFIDSAACPTAQLVSGACHVQVYSALSCGQVGARRTLSGRVATPGLGPWCITHNPGRYGGRRSIRQAEMSGS